MSKITCINNCWKFHKIGEEAVNVDLPHTYNLDDSDNEKKMWTGITKYEKVLDVNVKDGERAFIEFGAVNSVADIFLNGKHVLKHSGGYSIFRVELTEFIVDSKVTIEVQVNNSIVEEVYPLMADFSFCGGIYRDVKLIITKDVMFDLLENSGPGVFVSQLNVTKEKALIEVKGCVVNAAENKKELTVNMEVLDMEGKLVVSHKMTSMIFNNSEFIHNFEITSPILWDGIKNPYLYNIVVSLFDGDTLVDTREIKTGLRFYHIDPQEGFFLNGNSCRLNGVSRHQCREGFAWNTNKDNQREDIEIIKEMGANSIRLAHYQHDQNFYDLCDEVGMVIWAEIPFISRVSSSDITGENAVSQLKELITQNYNHSSILMWGVQNEITIGEQTQELNDIVDNLNNIAKRMDPYRVTTQAHVGHHEDGDYMNKITDILAYNKYYGWYYDEVENFEEWLTGYNKLNPNQCLGISEYGAEGILAYQNDDPKIKDYSESYHALYHEKVMPIFNAHNEIWGTYVWNMFDFASDFRDEGGVQGMNNKGLVTHDRKTRKDAFFYYKALWSNEVVLSIVGKRHIERKESIIPVKLYTNEKEVTLSVNGQVLDTKSPVNCTIIFKDIVLKNGENKIVVESENAKDECIFILNADSEINYVFEGGNTGLMDNWFDEDQFKDEVIGELTFDDGFYSIKDTIGTIIKNPEGEKVMRKYMDAMFDHPMFEMTKGFNFEKLKAFSPDQFSDSVLYVINVDLQKVEK